MTSPWFCRGIDAPDGDKSHPSQPLPKPILVYRIQNAVGLGPFYTDDGRFFYAEDAPQLEAIEKDRKVNPGFFYGWAYPSLIGVSRLSAFEPTRYWMVKNGFRVVSFVAHHVVLRDDHPQGEIIFARRRPLTEGGVVLPWPPRDLEKAAYVEERLKSLGVTDDESLNNVKAFLNHEKLSPNIE